MRPKGAWFEAIDWLLFSIGAFVAAFILPAQILITLIFGVPVPNGVLASSSLVYVAKLYLFFVLGGVAWHGMHRVRFVLYDLGLSHHRRMITIVTMTSLLGILVWTSMVVFFQ